jgi:serine/threonine protein kinase
MPARSKSNYPTTIPLGAGLLRSISTPVTLRECTSCSISVAESGRFCPSCGAILAESGSDKPLAATAPGSDRSAAAASLVGKTVDGFVIEGVIGGGAFGTVYRGRQQGLDRVVAIKVPTYEIAADPIMSKRFAREARSAARIHHPGVVTIYAVGELTDGRPYLAMQLVEGQPLDSILKDGPVPLERALGIARQIASALSETHAAGVVHRDLKPTNIMWHRDRNGDDRITLVDFGIAVCKLAHGSSDITRLTQNGLIGTPHYMSPEQAHGDNVDARADLYALGCLLFELITAAPPFEGSGFEVLLAHLGRPAPKPSERNPDIPEVVDRLVARLLAKKPDDRAQSADEVVSLIDETLDVLEARRSAPDASKPRPRRKTGKTAHDRPVARPITNSERTRAGTHSGASSARWSARARYLSLGALGALALAGAGFAAYKIVSPDVAASADNNDRGDDTASAPDPNEPVKLLLDDVDARLKVWWRDNSLVAKKPIRFRFEVRNKLGNVIRTDQLIVTLEDPNKHSSGFPAYQGRRNPDTYSARITFPMSGVYNLRVMVPESNATFDFAVRIP